ncbi:MAG: DUF465 domain-containing protein [Pseudomonadota bacterium]
MPAMPHALPEAFPHFENAVRRLREEDAHFEKMASQYDALSDAIRRAHAKRASAQDARVRTMHRQRLWLLDEIAERLREDQATR